MSKISKPEWLEEFRRRTRIINIIERAFDNNCDCEVCRELRDIAFELADLFMPPRTFETTPGPRVRRGKRR